MATTESIFDLFIQKSGANISRVEQVVSKALLLGAVSSLTGTALLPYVIGKVTFSTMERILKLYSSIQSMHLA